MGAPKLTDMVQPTEIARLKITLDDVAPAVVRRIEVPFRIRLDRLHAVLQAAVGWTNSHLWEFRARDVGWGIPDPGWGDGPLDASKATLAAVVKDTGAKRLTYLYDFGDGWEHTIRIERIGQALPGELYPRLLDATGARPPEDIGGPPGYAEFLAAIADPQHERYAEFSEFYDTDFDPNVVNVIAIQQRLTDLARRWSRSKPKQPKFA
jgi:Plasmid pRiA4b ORF-3-like protein